MTPKARKKMRDDSDIEMVSRLLSDRVGLHVVKVPVSKTPKTDRCDLAASEANEKYLIEVGGFDDDERIRPTLQEGKMYESVEHYFSRDQVTKKIRKAVNQLRDTAPDYLDHLWLAVLIARSKIDIALMAEQIRGTLYGMADIVESQAAGNDLRHRCLYFRESAFFRHRELDGAIVIYGREVAFYMNDYSYRLERLRQSSLAKFMRQNGGLYDKQTWAGQGELLADFEGDRKDSDAMLERLRQQYPNRNLRISVLKHYEFLL